MNLNEKEIKQLIEQEEPFEFSHTLEELIGWQLQAGFAITDFYEDSCTAEDNDLLSKYMQTFFTTLAMKL